MFQRVTTYFQERYIKSQHRMTFLCLEPKNQPSAVSKQARKKAQLHILHEDKAQRAFSALHFCLKIALERQKGSLLCPSEPVPAEAGLQSGAFSIKILGSAPAAAQPSWRQLNKHLSISVLFAAECQRL